MWSTSIYTKMNMRIKKSKMKKGLNIYSMINVTVGLVTLRSRGILR